MTKWTPKDPPVGQVPAGILKQSSARKKPGRPKRKAAPPDSPVESVESGPPAQTPESTVASTPATNTSNDSVDSSKSHDSTSSGGNSTASAKSSSPASVFAGRRDKARYGTPRRVPSKAETAKFDDWAKRFHSSPDMRLVGDLSTYNPPPDGPVHPQGPVNPMHIPGIQVRKEPMRPARRRMSAEDGYFDQEISADGLPRFFDSLRHDYTIDSHAISHRASIEWIDTPGFSPADIRARRLKILVPSEDIKNKPDEIIWRVTYSCNGLCRASPTREDKIPALATKDSFGVELFQYIKGRRGTKEQEKVAQRRLSPRASMLRMERIAREASEAEEQGADKAPTGTESNATQNTADTHQHEGQQSSDCSCQAAKEQSDATQEKASQDTDEQDELDDDEGGENASENDQSKKQNDKKNECVCGSYLMISMTNAQSQFARCTVRMRRESHHPRPRVGTSVKMSPHIRSVLHEMAGCFSMTKSKLKLWFNTTIAPNDPHVVWLRSCKKQKDMAYLGDRLPGKNGWDTAMKTAGQIFHVNSSPLAAIEIIAGRSPESLIAHRGPQFLGSSKDKDTTVDPPSKKTPGGRERMECVIAPPLARISAILQIFRMGLMMDSSWRNKNAWGAPMTVLVTLNEQHHMIPLAVMVSAHADHIAYEYLLREFERACRETAMEVVTGTFRPDIDGVSEADLVRQCRIFLKDGLSPRFVMIDRSHAERVAVSNVLQDVPIRVCQFHMMQATES